MATLGRVSVVLYEVDVPWRGGEHVSKPLLQQEHLRLLGRGEVSIEQEGGRLGGIWYLRPQLISL